MCRYFSLLVMGLLLVAASVPLSAETLVEISRIRSGDLEARGFELKEAAEIEIEAVGLPQRYGSQLGVYAWIIGHDSREPVWVMKERFSSKRGRRSPLREVEKVKALDPGKYELYFFAGEDWYVGNISYNYDKGFFDILEDVFGDEDDRWDDAYDSWEYDDLVEDCFIRLNSEDVSKSEIQTFDITGELPGALMLFTQLGDDEYIRQAFTLDKSMSLRIYSVFEYPKSNRQPVDAAWIVNSDTHERVWEITRRNTERAGGGKKNRSYDDEVKLEKGNYVLHFATDDSHSFELFNVSPPYDPYNWGITVLPGSDFDQSAFKLVELPKGSKALIDLTRARDDDFMEQAFRLEKETTFRVYAIGEYSTRDREFVDYGWIEKAGTGEIVWEMTKRNTQYAGGGDKNRMFDGAVTLSPGDYIAVFSTDGSHSYRDWNVTQPYDPAGWGMAIFAGPDSDGSSLTTISKRDLESNPNVLVNMTRVRDNERLRGSFKLDKKSRVHIYAIGEGQKYDMFDYAWIIDDRTGRSVWEMTWRNTDHAGGAKKNRIFRDDIELDEGEYEVYYVTDGSHSFGDWNSRRPRDPHHWGVTVSLVD